MRSRWVLVVACVVAASAASSPSEPKEDCVIVLRPNATIEEWKDIWNECAWNEADGDTFQLGFGSRTSRVSIGKFIAVSSRLTASQMQHLEEAHSDVVDYVEESGRVAAMDLGCPDVRAEPTYWGARRTTSDLAVLDPGYVHNASWGSGVDVYVVDSGVDCTHASITGHCACVKNFIEDEDCSDVAGHGTHVASSVAGSDYGIAPAANIVAVKVLNRYGSGSSNNVILGIEWSTAAIANSGRRGVINLSLGTSKRTALNDAVNAAVDIGVVVVAAAGNSDMNACNYSPGSATKVVTVGATGLKRNGAFGAKDYRATFSNWGSCVDVFAPGVFIKGAGIDSTTATTVMDGTSMAAPHVAGAAAALLSVFPGMSAPDVRAYLLSNALQSVIVDFKGNSENLLLHLPCEPTPDRPRAAAGAAVPVEENCFGDYHQVIAEREGFLDYPEGSAYYSIENMWCWKILCPGGNLDVTWIFLAVETGWDFLYANDDVLTGYRTPPPGTYADELTLRLTSDVIFGDGGFTLSWTCDAPILNDVTYATKIRFQTGWVDGSQARGLFIIEVTYFDGTVASGGFLTGAQLGELVTFTMIDMPQASDQLQEVRVTGGADSWCVIYTEVEASEGVFKRWVLPEGGHASAICFSNSVAALREMPAAAVHVMLVTSNTTEHDISVYFKYRDTATTILVGIVRSPRAGVIYDFFGVGSSNSSVMPSQVTFQYNNHVPLHFAYVDVEHANGQFVRYQAPALDFAESFSLSRYGVPLVDLEPPPAAGTHEISVAVTTSLMPGSWSLGDFWLQAHFTSGASWYLGSVTSPGRGTVITIRTKHAPQPEADMMSLRVSTSMTWHWHISSITVNGDTWVCQQTGKRSAWIQLQSPSAPSVLDFHPRGASA
ncbi:Extracellular serine proteinase [Diplonema papillatum]|nr:Extracellular serine proteinase [Diplonema papillatum]